MNLSHMPRNSSSTNVFDEHQSNRGTERRRSKLLRERFFRGGGGGATSSTTGLCSLLPFGSETTTNRSLSAQLCSRISHDDATIIYLSISVQRRARPSTQLVSTQAFIQMSCYLLSACCDLHRLAAALTKHRTNINTGSLSYMPQRQPEQRV